jgi:3-oxoacyl-[acyl-carrier-protein] synthase III
VRGARLLGLGDHRPSRVLTNDELARTIDTTDEWIRTRTGIHERRIAGEGEGVVEMAASAAAKALAAAGVDPADIDLTLLATCSLPSNLPGGAAGVATALGAGRSGAVDLNAACAGFVYALSWAADAVRTGSARTVLVIGSERLSDFVDWDDRSTCILFGDGAGAAVVGATGRDADGIGPVVWGSDGEQSEAIRIDATTRTVAMDGAAVFRWATTALAPVAREACERAGIAPEQLAAFVPHQANVRIVDALAKTLGVDPAKVCRDIAVSGNTSAASIPLGLTRMVETGELTSGDPVLVLGFGSGLTYAAQVVRVP